MWFHVKASGSHIGEKHEKLLEVGISAVATSFIANPGSLNVHTIASVLANVYHFYFLHLLYPHTFR